MRLFLSSYGLGNNPDKLLRLLNGKTKTAIVANAADYHTVPERAERVLRDQTEFSEIGITADELDLRDYFDDHAQLAHRMADYDLIWLRGGNTFVLQRAIIASRFDTAIKALLKNDEIVYGGFSAGACVATESLRGIDLVDDPTVVPDGYEALTPWEGMGLVGFSIAPHYKSGHPESADIDRTVTYFLHNNMPYKTLKDGEAIIVDGSKHEVLV